MKYYVKDPHGQEFVLDTAEERDALIEEFLNYWAEDYPIVDFTVERDENGSIKTVNFTADGSQRVFSTYETPSD